MTFTFKSIISTFSDLGRRKHELRRHRHELPGGQRDRTASHQSGSPKEVQMFNDRGWSLSQPGALTFRSTESSDDPVRVYQHVLREVWGNATQNS